MTTLTQEPMTATVPSQSRRIWNVVRLHVANPWPTLRLPWIIIAAVFALTYAIWRLVLNAAGGVDYIEAGAFQMNGGVTWILFYMVVVAVQTISLTFTFALGYSVTRRDYFAGTALFFVLMSAMYAAGLTAMAVLERATDGWGVDGAFFAPFFLTDAPLATVAFSYLMLMLCALFVGSSVATVWLRWKANGLVAFFVALAVVIVIVGWVLTETDSWTSVGSWLNDAGTVTLMAWLLVPTVLGVLGGFAMLRRATPRG